jgi:hypothetical protein
MPEVFTVTQKKLWGGEEGRGRGQISNAGRWRYKVYFNTVSVSPTLKSPKTFALQTLRPYCFPSFDYGNNVWQNVKIMKLPIR